MPLKLLIHQKSVFFDNQIIISHAHVVVFIIIIIIIITIIIIISVIIIIIIIIVIFIIIIQENKAEIVFMMLDELFSAFQSNFHHHKYFHDFAVNLSCTACSVRDNIRPKK